MPVTTAKIFFSGFAIEGPSQAKIECDDQNDGSCDVKYWPKEPGEYAVHIMCDDEDIKDSPYMAYIHPASLDFNPDKARIQRDDDDSALFIYHSRQ